MADLYTQNELIVLFNTWQRNYIVNPEAFDAEWKVVLKFLDEEVQGVEPSYGRDCVNYLEFLRNQ